MARTVQIVLELDDRGSAKVRSFGQTTTDTATRTAGKVEALGKSFEVAGQRALKLSGALMPVSIAVGALEGFAARAAIKFESSFAGVRKTVDATEDQFTKLSTSIRRLASGPDAIPIDVNELNKIAELGGQLGRGAENLVEFTEVMAKLGVTTNLSSEQAATSLARFSNIMGTAEGDVDRLGSVIVELGNNMATTEAEIVEMGLRLAGAGRQIGLTEAQVLAFAGSLSSLGIEAEAGGTALSRVFVEVAKQVRSGGKNLDDFAKIAGLSVREFSDLFQRDGAEAVVRFVEGLDLLSKSGVDVFTVLEGVEFENIRVRDSLLRMSSATGQVREALGLANEEWTENNALTEEAAKRFATAESRLKVATNRINDAAISIGARIVPAIATLLDRVAGLVKAFEGLPAPVQYAALAFGGLLAVSGPLLAVYGRLLPLLPQLAQGALSMALGFDKAAVAMSLSVSAGTTLAAMSIGQIAGFGALTLAAGGFGYAIGRIISQVTGLDDVMRRLFDRALNFEQFETGAQKIVADVEDVARSFRRLTEKGIRFAPDVDTTKLLEAERLLREFDFEAERERRVKLILDGSSFQDPQRVFDQVTRQLGQQKIKLEAEVNEASVRKVADRLQPLLQSAAKLPADQFAEFGRQMEEAGAKGLAGAQQIERALTGVSEAAAKAAAAAAPPSTEEMDALFEKLSSAGLAAGKMAEVLSGDYAKSLGVATKLGIEENDVLRAYRDEIHEMVAALHTAGEEMPAAFRKIFEASRELESIDVFFNMQEPLDPLTGLSKEWRAPDFIGPEVPEELFKKLEKDVLAVEERIRGTKLSMFEQALARETTMTEGYLENILRLQLESENARFEAAKQLHAGHQGAIEALEEEHQARVDQINITAEQRRRDATLGLWTDLHESLLDRSIEFIDNIGLAWADFVDSGIQNVSNMVGQLALGMNQVGGDWQKLAKQMGAQAVAMLTEWAIRRFIVGKLSVASTASEGAAAMAVSAANIFANVFASLSAIPIIGPAIAAASTPGITTAALAGAAGAGATGGALGAALALAGGAEEGGLIKARRLIEVGEAGEEAIVPLRGAAAERAAHAMGLDDLRAEMRAMRDGMDSVLRSGGGGSPVVVNLHVHGDNWRDNGISHELRNLVHEALEDGIGQGRLRPLPRGRR